MLSCKDIKIKSHDNNRHKLERETLHKELSARLKSKIKWDLHTVHR